MQAKLSPLFFKSKNSQLLRPIQYATSKTHYCTKTYACKAQNSSLMNRKIIAPKKRIYANSNR